MIKLNLFISIILYCLLNHSDAQINLIQSPKSKAFIPQNKKTRSAKFKVIGEVTTGGYTHISIKVFQNGALKQNHKKPLIYNNGKANFNQLIELKTAKTLYDITYELNGRLNYSFTVKGILVGDVYIIQGQSNAVAGSYNAFNTQYYSPYLRSFGTASRDAGTVKADTNWTDINAIFTSRRGSVGQWGAVMARHLLDSFNTPICLLNGAVGGTSVLLHQPSLMDREDLRTIYGRLLYRTRKAKLDSFISGIIYFQGESDGRFPNRHKNGFMNLHQSWKKDYPNFSKLYVVQVRDGCGSPTLPMREVQRQFEFSIPNCKVISANGLNNHDGCHYGFVNGYEKLGFQISKLVARDFYWPKDIIDIDPPNIDYCYYTDGLQKEIILEMRNPNSLILADPNFASLFEIEGDTSVRIINGQVTDNNIRLTLNKHSCSITGLSYNGKRGAQPWVTNKHGMGLISFYNSPVLNLKKETDQLVCKNTSSKIGLTPLNGIRYTIEQLSSGLKINSSLMSLSLEKEDSFKVTLFFDSLNCIKKDSTIIRVQVDNVILPDLEESYSICQGDSFHFNFDSFGYATNTWSQNGEVQKGYSFTTTSAGIVKQVSRSVNGCFYSNETNINTLQNILPLNSSYSLCYKDSLVLQIPEDSFVKVLWEDYDSAFSKTIYAAGNYSVEAITKDGCFIDKVINVIELNNPDLILDQKVCNNQSVPFYKPDSIQEWFRNGQELGSFIFLKGSEDIPLRFVGVNGCKFTDTLKVSTFKASTFPSRLDTLICKNQSITINLPVGMSNYYINNKKLSSPSSVLNDTGLYTYRYTDSNLCVQSGVVDLSFSKEIDLSEFQDTVLCKYDSILVRLPDSVSYQINNTPVSGTFVIKPNNIYEINAVDKNKCETFKKIFISAKNCSLNNHDLDHIKIYPVPFSKYIHIEKLGIEPQLLELYTSQGRLIYSKYQDILPTETINLEQFPAGIYLLKVDNLTFYVRKN